MRFIDWIWHVRGSLALAPGQSSDDAFGRLDPLFRPVGTTRQRTNGTLTFSKKDPAAQDKMAVFDRGVLMIRNEVAGYVLRYNLTSHALLFCFLAPFLFIGIAQLTIYINKFDKPARVAEKKHAPIALNPIDKALGAPAPENSKGDHKEGGRNKKPSPTPAYVIAGLFAVLYVIGRILEDVRIRKRFRRRLMEAG